MCYLNMLQHNISLIQHDACQIQCNVNCFIQHHNTGLTLMQHTTDIIQHNTAEPLVSYNTTPVDTTLA